MNLSMKIRIVQCDFDSSFTQSGKQKNTNKFLSKTSMCHTNRRYRQLLKEGRNYPCSNQRISKTFASGLGITKTSSLSCITILIYKFNDFILSPLCRNITAKCRFTLLIYLCLKKALVARSRQTSLYSIDYRRRKNWHRQLVRCFSM